MNDKFYNSMHKPGRLRKRLTAVLAFVFALCMVGTAAAAGSAPGVQVSAEIFPLSVYANAVAQAVEPPASDFTYTDNGDGTLTITKYNGSETDIIFPAAINGKDVTQIGSGAYEGIVIPDCVTSVVVPEGIKIIASQAFDWWYMPNNSSLKYVKLPESLTTIAAGSFHQCHSLEYIDVDVNNQYYSSENGVLFDKNKTLLMHYPSEKQDSEYTVPSTVKKIESNAISFCYSLKKLNISEGTEEIGINAFWEMRGLETVTIPSTLTSVDGTFLEYMDDTLVICEETVDENLISEAKSVLKYKTENGQVSLIGYSGIKNTLDLPDTVNGVAVKSIERSAFNACAGLTSVNIPEGVTTIGDSAFVDCTGLASVNIPDSVTSIGDNAFVGCSGLTSVTIPGNVTAIGNYAFSGCTSLDTIIYSASVTPGTNAIPDTATQLEYTVENGSITITNVELGTGKTSVDIPQEIDGLTVTAIGESAFYHCDKLTAVQLPDSVTAIGKRAFEGCTGLTSVNIPDSVKDIGEFAFFSCTDLTSVNIPRGVTDIKKNAFSGCTELTSIVIPDGVTNIGNLAFEGCTGLTSVNIPNSVTNIGRGAFAGCAGLTSVDIPEGVASIGDNAFASCTGLTSVDIPKSVTSIGENAFNRCSGLETVTYPAGVNVDNAGIPDTVTVIEYTVNSDNTVTVTDIKPGDGKTAVEISDTIDGKPVVSVREELRDIVSQDKHGHKGGNATCTEKGKCDICGTEYMDAAGHSFANYISDNNATCQQDGTKTAKCDKCTVTDTVTDPGTKTAHSYGEDGKCIRCGAEKPADPVDPGDPTKPTDPTNPEDPTKPAEPTNPEEPTKPTDPTNPEEPTKPTEPEKPVTPAVYGISFTGDYMASGITVTGERTAGSIMTVRVPVGYTVTVMSGRNVIARISEGTGTFVMPAGNVSLSVESYLGMLTTGYANSYIYSYDSDMNHIRTNSVRGGMTAREGVVAVKLGEEYAGKSVTLYKGRNSASVKVDEAVLDENGCADFTVESGKVFTLVVE